MYIHAVFGFGLRIDFSFGGLIYQYASNFIHNKGHIFMNFDGMILTFYKWICVVHCVHQESRTSAWRLFTTSLDIKHDFINFYSGLISLAVKTYFDRKAVKTRLKPVKTGLNRSKRGQNLKLRNMCQGLWKNPVRWIYISPSVYGLCIWFAENLCAKKWNVGLLSELLSNEILRLSCILILNVTTQSMLLTWFI